MQSWNAIFFLFFIFVGGGGWFRALNLTVPLGSGRVGSDDLGYGPGSGFSFEPVQTSSSPHSKPSQPPLGAWRARRVHPHLFSVWQLGDALSFPRYSPSFRRRRAACVGTQSILPCSVRTPCWPPVSPALHTPSTRTRTPRALLRGGGCSCSRFGPATHFSLGNIPPASTGFNWR